MAKGKKNRPQADTEESIGDVKIVEGTDSDEKTMLSVSAKAPKSKKDRKKKKDEELEEAQRELDRMNMEEADLEGATSLQQVKLDEDHESGKRKGKPKAKADKKDKKKKQSSDEEDNSEEEHINTQKSAFALLMDDEGDSENSNDNNSEDEVVNKPVPKAKPKSKKSDQPKLKSAFAMLAEADSDAAEESDDISEEKSLQDESKVERVVKDKKDKKKKKKEKKGAGGSEEIDDLDKALAELGLEKNEEAISAAQKKKDKKERQKQKIAEAEQGMKDGSEPPDATIATEDAPEEDISSKSKKGGKKKKGDKDDEAQEKDDKGKKGKKGPGSKMKLAMQEALKAVQEEDEQKRKDEEERIRKEEEAEDARLEKKRLEEEKKAAKKERERLKKEQLKKEGKYLTKNQKEAQARAQAMLEAMRAQGVDVPMIGEKRAPRPGTRIRNKAKSATPETDSVEESAPAPVNNVPEVKVVVEEAHSEEVENSELKDECQKDDGVAESWDAEIDTGVDMAVDSKDATQSTKTEICIQDSAVESEKESESEESEEEDESDDQSDDSEEDVNDRQNRRAKANERIKQRREQAERNITTDVLRAGVVCVLGHVDTGKTKILDKLRRTNVQDGEAGGITQQIGATNVPLEVIKEQCKMVKDFGAMKIPGLLIIDTPGHESFSNLRDRGSSLCDIAILVIDIMHGLEPQTIESISLLKKKKTPFVIALNKIDRLYEWKSNRHKDIEDVVKSQPSNTRMEFDKHAKEAVIGMAEQGLNAALCYENPDPKNYISMVPTSAHTGEGIGNLIALLVNLSQTLLAKRLAFSEELQATVLEVKAIPGLGTTIDIVLVNGTLKEGQTMVLAGTEGPVVTPIKALLTPQKMQDLRVKNQYIHHKELRAAQGVKIEAKELEKCIAGLNLLIAHHPDEIDICKEEIEERLSTVMNSFKTKDRGVFVQASTLGSLEALLEFLRTSKIPVASVKVGPVVRRDVMRASVMLEHEEKYTVILAFDVRVEREAQEMADNMGVKIFQADIIYHLFDRFTAYQEELKNQKRDQFKNVAVFPCKLRMLPNSIFKSRDPIVAGVAVEAGIIRPGTPLCVPSREFCDLGICSSIQRNNNEVESARKGEEICIKIEPIPGEAPKMFGRHFDDKDMVVSKVSRTSIDACKNYFRDDLQKSDWQLMVELKKTFQIL